MPLKIVNAVGEYVLIVKLLVCTGFASESNGFWMKTKEKVLIKSWARLENEWNSDRDQDHQSQVVE